LNFFQNAIERIHPNMKIIDKNEILDIGSEFYQEIGLKIWKLGFKLIKIDNYRIF
jgi:hypothetical protein